MPRSTRSVVTLARRLRRRAMRAPTRPRRAHWTRALTRARRELRRRRHRFDHATVTWDWLWVLTECRRRGWRGGVNGRRGGLRTFAMQASLYALFLAGKGAPAFHPRGPSRHLIRNVKKRGGWSQAVDCTDPEGLIRQARELGVTLHRPYPHEPWHVEAKRRFRAPVSWTP